MEYRTKERKNKNMGKNKKKKSEKEKMIEELGIDWESVANGLDEFRHIIQDIAILPNISKKEYVEANRLLTELIEKIRDGEIADVVSNSRLEQYLLEKEDEMYYDEDDDELPFR